MESVLGIASGEVTPLFVSFGGHNAVTDGAELSKAQAAHAPHVDFKGDAGKLYTLIMVDPDAPSPDNPTMAQWLHWIVANIPEGDVSKGDTITLYAGPTPPRGTHRYIITMYEQPEGVKLPKTHIEQRAKFSAAKWAAEHKLSAHPVAAVHFVTKAGH
jgi:phosphatidylethanolamine-binding protein (PEBP) family uncharacterized protein